ncbi:TRM6 [Lepeophtheirus salmonis]|nr:TRM6 [Lepeophtheirus salmonis]CAF2983440.1 TRM6 [Lepeophtheirus salmonis]
MPDKRDVFKLKECLEGEKRFEEHLINETTLSGEDNRNISDGSVQKLSRNDVEKLRESGSSGTEIVEKLMENSDSFNSKTRYSQAKFLKKKAKKYYPYLSIGRPSIRVLMDIFYKQDPIKLMNLRIDSLSLILSRADIRPNGRYIIYESGCRGIIVAAALERIGSSGNIIHLYQTGTPQNQSLEAMNFPAPVSDRLSTINLSHFRTLSHGGSIQLNPNDGKGGSKREAFRQESMKAFEVMQNKDMDGLIIASKQHPTNIVLTLLDYLAPSRSFVVYCPYKEPLIDAYMAVKETNKTIMVTLSESWLRYIQVLPDRTHPEVLMSGGGGYVLAGIKVDNS